VSIEGSRSGAPLSFFGMSVQNAGSNPEQASKLQFRRNFDLADQQ
jgi:hypothetical protein